MQTSDSKICVPYLAHLDSRSASEAIITSFSNPAPESAAPESLAKPYQVKLVRSVIVRYKQAGGRMTKYEIILYWSVDDEAFIAEVPELPGCAADGPTRQEALANSETVIQEWIETARELGRPIPEPKGRLLFA